MHRAKIFIIIALAISCFACIVQAANVSFNFNMTNTGSQMYVDTTGGNSKAYINQDATVRVNSVNAPGFGYRLALVNSSYVLSTVQYWYNSNDSKHYHSFLSNMAQSGELYYMAGRIDNDYYGQYQCSGKYNSDKVSSL